MPTGNNDTVSRMIRVSVPSDVLVRHLEAETVLLSFESESYFGLDDVGTQMWLALGSCDSTHAAWEKLASEYAVEPERLRADLAAFIDKLVELRLLTIVRE